MTLNLVPKKLQFKYNLNRNVLPHDINLNLPFFTLSCVPRSRPTCYLTWLISVAWWQQKPSPLPSNILTWSPLPHTNPSEEPGKNKNKRNFSKITLDLLQFCDCN